MKRNRSKDVLIKKLRKLEKEILLRDESDSDFDTENDRNTGSSSSSPTQSPTREMVPDETPADTEEQAEPEEEIQPQNQATVGPIISASTVDQETPTIPQEILAMLGEAKKVESPLGAKIPSEISERWGKIVVDGLEKNQKEQLLNTMLIPENFLLARAPKLNIEVSSVPSEPIKNRDKRLELTQNQLGIGIAGLANLTKDLIYTDMRKLDIIKRISEISQILLDLHYEETGNRRRLIVPLLEKNFLNIIKGVKRDEYLFGAQLGEKIKNSKVIEKSGQQIKKTTMPYKKPLQTNNQQGNLRLPPRPTNTPRPSPTRRDPAPAPASRRPAPTARSRPPARNNDRRSHR